MSSISYYTYDGWKLEAFSGLLLDDLCDLCCVFWHNVLEVHMNHFKKINIIYHFYYIRHWSENKTNSIFGRTQSLYNLQFYNFHIVQKQK